jgi:hypothetical protein
MRFRPSPVAIRWTVGIVLGVVILAWFTAPNPARQDDDTDPFTGRWLVNGEDPFGTEYSGSLTIQAESGAYRLDWIVSGALLSGTGRTSGDRLEADWSGTIAGEAVDGTATYRVDGELIEGTLQIVGLDGTGRESGELAR